MADRTILVEGKKTFRVQVPDEAKLTFGPWTPKGGEDKYGNSDRVSNNGTLRIYENAKTGASLLAVFSGVTGYRDAGIAYEEQLLVETGSIIWKSDQNEYKREEAIKRNTTWADPNAQLESGEEE